MGNCQKNNSCKKSKTLLSLKREFIDIYKCPLDKEEEDSIRVLSYNVLADNSKIEHYLRCDSPQRLSFKRRGRRIIEEITEINSDVICLQVKLSINNRK